MADADSGLRGRTKAFGLRVIRVVESLPRNAVTSVIGRQLVDSGTSVGANYRSACGARSPAEFRVKMGIVEEEADESAYWIELLVDAGHLRHEKVRDLINEAHEIVAMTVASIRTSRLNGGSRKPRPRLEKRTDHDP